MKVYMIAVAAGLAFAVPVSRANAAQGSPPPSAIPFPTAERTITARDLRLQIGEDVEFHRVSDLAVRTDGGILVVNAGSFQLLQFDSTGRQVATIGRRGGGPGEYQSMREIALLAADSIVVMDGIARRVTTLSPKGVYVRSFSLIAPFEGGGSANRVVALRNGTLLVGFSEITTMAPAPEAKEFRERLFPFRSDGSQVDGTSVSLFSSEHFVQAAPPDRGGVAYWSRAFGRTQTVRASGTNLLTGDGAEWRIDQRSIPTGDVRSTIRLSRSPSPVTKADIAALHADELRGIKGRDSALAEKRLAEMPFPQTMPAYSRFEVDERGRIWIEEYAPRAGQSRRWIRADPVAKTAIAVRFPDRFKPYKFARSAVYGVFRDSDDVEHIHVYNLRSIP